MGLKINVETTKVKRINAKNQELIIINNNHLYWGNFFIKDMVFKKDLKTRYIL